MLFLLNFIQNCYSNLTREHVETNPGEEIDHAVPPGRDPGCDNVWAEDLHDDVELQGVREEDGKRVQEECHLSSSEKEGYSNGF